MSGAHEGCSQGKSVRDREGSKHSTAATPERVDSEAAVLPQDFEDTVHARQLKALCRRVGRRMSRQGPGRSPSMGLTHLNAARPREKSSGVPHCGSSKILSDLVSHRRATRPPPDFELSGPNMRPRTPCRNRAVPSPRRQSHMAYQWTKHAPTRQPRRPGSGPRSAGSRRYLIPVIRDIERRKEQQ
jgi:hypothetical protein